MIRDVSLKYLNHTLNMLLIFELKWLDFKIHSNSSTAAVADSKQRMLVSRTVFMCRNLHMYGRQNNDAPESLFRFVCSAANL